MANKGPRQYTWYVEATDSYTNMVLSQHLVDELRHEGKICADDERHDLWECPNYASVSRFMRDRYDLGLHFTVFIQEGAGKIRKWRFRSRVDSAR